jgi:hypothetical protein
MLTLSCWAAATALKLENKSFPSTSDWFQHTMISGGIRGQNYVWQNKKLKEVLCDLEI